MLKMLLFDNFIDHISKVNVITGIVMAALGLALTLLARRITRSIRKTETVDNADKIYLGIKAFALVMILAALILMIIE